MIKHQYKTNFTIGTSLTEADTMFYHSPEEMQAVTLYYNHLPEHILGMVEDLKVYLKAKPKSAITSVYLNTEEYPGAFTKITFNNILDEQLKLKLEKIRISLWHVIRDSMPEKSGYKFRMEINYLNDPGTHVLEEV